MSDRGFLHPSCALRPRAVSHGSILGASEAVLEGSTRGIARLAGRSEGLARPLGDAVPRGPSLVQAPRRTAQAAKIPIPS